MISGSGENFLMITLQSTIIGNWLHENAPMGRGTLGPKLGFPFLYNMRLIYDGSTMYIDSKYITSPLCEVLFFSTQIMCVVYYLLHC